jgi:carbamoyl-phosphate synthase large subunit
LKPDILNQLKAHTRALAGELNVVGLMNIQYAIKNDVIYVLEVNPRASRTVPFVSKASGVPLAKLATKVIVGNSLEDLGLTEEVTPKHISVKESVFPFARFPGVDTILGPEMKSTGEVMGIDRSFELAFAKSQLAAGQKLPLSGTVFISVRDEDKMIMLRTALLFYDLGFKIVATKGTATFLSNHGLTVKKVKKVREGRPHIVDIIKNGEIDLVINTTSAKREIAESYSIRATALTFDIPYTTTIAGAWATALAIRSMIEGKLDVKTLQEYHEKTVNRES